jgi:CRP-like cAMP-binding protein
MAIAAPKACKQCALYSDSDNFCARLSDDELIGLNRKSHTATMKRGDSLSDEALLQWPVIAVSSGVLSLQHLLVDGRKSIAALYMQGDVIDLRGISNRNRCNLISLGKSDICRLSPDAFEKIVSNNTDAQNCIWTNLREQTFRAIDHSVDLSKKQALEKLASFIIECNHREFSKSKTTVVANIPVRRVDLAEYIGVQPETVSRCFKDLQSRGIIKFEKLSELTVSNPDALREIASGDRQFNSASE